MLSTPAPDLLNAMRDSPPQAGAHSATMLWPLGEIVNTLVPASPAPVTPAMPDTDPPTTVTWPPVRKVCLPANVRVTESFAAL